MNSLDRLQWAGTGDRRWAAAIGALLLSCGGIAIFVAQVDPIYPVKDWFFWSLASLWGWLLLFSVSCLSFGQFLLVRVLGVRRLPVLESLALSMALGTVSFVIGMYLGGAFGLFNATFALLLPLSFCAISAREGTRLFARVWVEFNNSRHSVLSALIAGAGVLYLGLIYLGVMTPDAINYDATWYHQTIAQDYARWGAIRPFLANYNRCVPHLASILYTWGYIVPGLSRVERWMCAQHLEFCLFLWTLVGVAAAVQRLVENWSLRSSWVALFLFPGIFIYDSNLGSSADHVLAFFSVAILLATLHVCHAFSRGNCIMLAATLAGATLTKYQAFYLIVPVVLIVSVAWISTLLGVNADRTGLVARSSRRELLWAPVILIGVGCVLVAPHFLKNTIFHKNPVYPFLLDVFTKSTPTVPDAKFAAERIFTDQNWVPHGTIGEKLWHALGLFFTFSFKPHYVFNKELPSFGSLFTLLLPGLLFVRARRSTAIAAVIAVGAHLLWGMTFNVDRNLQTFMPILVCVTAAIIVKMWNIGWWVRVGLIPLIALQVVWSADAPFFSGLGRMVSSMSLAKSGFEGRAKTRFDGFLATYVAIGEALPKDAKLLLHNLHLSLGINRDVFLDSEGMQGLITYRYSRTPRELFDYYRSIGITHILDSPDGILPWSRQAQVLYLAFVNRYAVRMPPPGGGYRLMAMPDTPPPAEAPYQVLCMHLGPYEDGLYPVNTLYKLDSIPVYLQNYRKPARPASGSTLTELLHSADAVMLGETADIGAMRAQLLTDFEQITKVDGAFLYLRRR